MGSPQYRPCPPGTGCVGTSRATGTLGTAQRSRGRATSAPRHIGRYVSEVHFSSGSYVHRVHGGDEGWVSGVETTLSTSGVRVCRRVGLGYWEGGSRDSDRSRTTKVLGLTFLHLHEQDKEINRFTWNENQSKVLEKLS